VSVTYTLTTPAGATYDIALEANQRFGAQGEELPDLEQRIEQGECEFEAGELTFTAFNEDGWWDTLLAGADRLARYPSTFSLVIARDGVTRWEGDIDLQSVSFDRGPRMVSFTAIGKLARLSRYSAEVVRRTSIPRYADWNSDMSSAPAAAALTLTGDGGGGVSMAVDPAELYAYVGTGASPAKIVKVRLSDMSRIDAIELATGENNAAALAIDDAGEYLYACCYTTAAKIVKIRLSDFTAIGTLTLETGENLASCAAWDSVTQHLYVGLAPVGVAGIIAKIGPGTTTPTRVAVLTLSSGDNYPYSMALDSAAGYGYWGCFTSPGRIVKVALAGNMTRTAALDLTAGENSIRGMAADVTRGYLYAGCWLSAIKVAKVAISSFTESAVLTLSAGENETRFLAIDEVNGHLFVGCNLSPGKIVKVQTAAIPAGTVFTRLDVVTLASGENIPYAGCFVPSRGILVVSTDTATAIVDAIHTRAMDACYKVTDTDKAWAQDAYRRHVLIDTNDTVVEIVGNEATVAIVGGAVANGSYRVRPFCFTTDIGVRTRTLSSDGPSVADLGLEVGDKIRIVSVESDTPRSTWSPKGGWHWEVPFRADSTVYEIKFVGPSTYPSLTLHQIQVDQDMTLDFAKGDGAIVDTPYHRNMAASDLLPLLFEAADLEADEYTVDVPDLDDGDVPYADFGGMNVGRGISEVARLIGCVLVATPSGYLCVPRDKVASAAGAGGSLDLIATEWTEQPFPDSCLDYIRVEGAEAQNVTRGLVGFLSNGRTITSDWLANYAWCKQVADRGWSVFGGVRASAAVKILDGAPQNAVADPSFEGAAAVNAAASPWRTFTAPAISGEALEKSASRACHLRRSLKLLTLGTQLQEKQLLFASGAVTASSSSGLLLTFTNDFEAYSRVRFTTTGTLPTGLTTGVDYWLVRVSATTARVATSLANAQAGTVVAYADAGTGTHTMTLQACSEIAAGDVVTLAARALVATRVSGNLHVDLYGKDSSGSVVLDTSSTYWNATTGGEFVEKRASVTIPGTVTHLWLRIFAGASSNFEAYVDEVRVEIPARLCSPTLLQRVSLGDETYIVQATREALRPSTAPSTMELELLGSTVTAASSGYDTTADDATPPQPEITASTAGSFDPDLDISVYDVEVTWPFPDAPVAELLLTGWMGSGNRPDAATNKIIPQRKSGSTTIFVASITVSNASALSAGEAFGDCIIVYFDGRISAPSAPYALPASS